jgi:Rieske Fe-S protein
MNTSLSRRALLRAAVTIAAGAGLCPLHAFLAVGQRASGDGTRLSTNCHTPDLDPACLTFAPDRVTVDLAGAPMLATAGHAANLIDRERGIDLIVVHVETGTFCALSRFCTHAGRTLAYIGTRKLLQCTNANHSTFQLDGDVRKGPAEAPLKSYPAMVREGRLEIGLTPEVAS